LVQIQQFIQGGHGSPKRQYQPTKLDMIDQLSTVTSANETSLYEEMRTMKRTQELIL